ncbi:MAG: leucine-rich repeat domain-containing protein [Clostridia bacterium]|nr:leucine-rich repeat domain-containing protein [Clostridia bacterium]
MTNLHETSFEKINPGKDLSFAFGSCGNDITWKLNGDTLIISGEGEMSNNYSPWYGYRNLIRKAVIEDGITSIGKYAFYYCENLEVVHVPESIKAIKDFAFHSCASLHDIKIPNALREIEPNAFINCDAFKKALKKKRFIAKLRLKRKYAYLDTEGA